MAQPILILPSGCVTSEEKAAAQKAGYVVIISDEPEKIKLITPSESIDGVDMLNAALVGLNKSFDNSAKAAFLQELVNRRKH